MILHEHPFGINDSRDALLSDQPAPDMFQEGPLPVAFGIFWAVDRNASFERCGLSGHDTGTKDKIPTGGSLDGFSNPGWQKTP